MKIIISCIHYPVASGRYMAAAFRRLGHEVRTLGDSTGNRIPWGAQGWMELDPKYAWASDGDLTKHWPDWTPDLIVHMDSSFAYHHPIYADVPHVVYGVDNHVRDYRQPGITRYFLAHKNVSVMSPPLAKDLPEAYTNTEWLPCGYDPIFFTPSPIPWADRAYDICMIGVMYPRRAELLSALQKAGLKVLAATGWVYEQYAAAYHNSRISLCVSANGDVAQRIFETAAMGCAILTDPLADLIDETTNKALGLKGFMVYDNVADCVDKARVLLSEDEGEPVGTYADDDVLFQLAGGGVGQFGARQMQESVLVKHTWDARAWRLVQWYKETYEGLVVNGGLLRNEPENGATGILEDSGEPSNAGTSISSDDRRGSETVEDGGGTIVIEAEAPITVSSVLPNGEDRLPTSANRDEPEVPHGDNAQLDATDTETTDWKAVEAPAEIEIASVIENIPAGEHIITTGADGITIDGEPVEPTPVDELPAPEQKTRKKRGH